MKAVILSLLMVSASTACFAQLDFNLAQENIRKVLTQQQNAWNSGDIEAFMQGYWKSDSLAFIGSRGITYGWQATLENYKKSYPDTEAMGKLTFDILRVELIGYDTAFVVGRWTLKRKNDQPNGYFTLLWKKIDGAWVITTDHSS